MSWVRKEREWTPDMMILFWMLQLSLTAKYRNAWLSYDQQFCRQAACDWSLSWDKVDTLSYGQWLLQASLRPTAMFAQVLITLRISVVLLTLTENLATPRLCATTSTTPLAAGTETAATPTPLLFQYPHCHGMHPATAQQWEKGP